MLLSEVPVSPTKTLLWGKPGCGKTPFVTSYGKGMQFIDCDDGLLSSRTLKDKWFADRQQVDVIQILEKDPTKALAWSQMKNTVMTIYNQCVKKEYPFTCLAIDSFTTLADFALRAISNSTTGKYTNPTQQHWGLAIGEIDNLFTWLKALPIPVVTIFHDRESTEGSGNDSVTIQEISIYGKNLPRKIISYFDEVVRVKTRTVSGKMEPYLQTISDAYTVARSRAGIPDGTKTEIGFREYLRLVDVAAKGGAK